MYLRDFDGWSYVELGSGTLTDPNWQPTSAYDTSKDVLEESRSTWQKAPTDSAWVPQDGFKKKPW